MIETNTWRSLESLAVRQRVRGHPAEAIAYMEQAITMTRGTPELQEETATMLNYLADTYLQEELLDQAEATIREAIQLTVAQPMSHADNLLILASILHKKHRQHEAEQAGREGLRLVRQEYGWDHAYASGVEKLLNRLEIPFSSGWFLGFVPPRITSFFAGLGRRLSKPLY